MYRRKGRILAGLLAMVLVFTSGGVSVLADETDDQVYTAGLCEHHQEHTADCGYDEATGTPCTYECDICGSDASDGEKTDQNGSGQNTGSEDGENTEDTSEDTTSGGAATAGDTADKTGTDETANAAMITDWSWIDEDGILQENDGVWGIGVPGASEDDPLTQDALLEMLPKQINATLSDGSDVTIDLTWDLSAIPEEGVWNGEYTVSASVDKTYSVSKDISAFRVIVTAGGSENYAASPDNLANGRVEGISPQGTTINVFDYWQTDDAEPAGDYESDRDHGINKNTVLKFGSGMATSSGDNATKDNVNAYTSSEQVRQGIVNQTLTDGYPSLSNAVDDSQSSLDYLFSPSVAHEGKASYRDADGLLQVDDEGYFYYDSIKTFAELDRETADFTLYEGNYYSRKNKDKLGDGEVGGAVAAYGTSPDGQFFPFNPASEVYKNAEEGNGISLDPDKKSNTMQHYFGLTMSTRFVQQDGGYTDSTRNTAVTYEFSGDDDVWVFIDGVLVADLGGIHDRASLKIDFSTGKIVINEGTNHVKTSTLHQQFSNARKQNSTKWSEDNSDTFADGTYHTLNFYYLERGGSDSNMSLKFNLVSIPASGIIKVDQAGNYIRGAEFVLYKADEDYQYNEETDAVCRGTTDSNGELIFTKINDAGSEEPVSLGELYSQKIYNLVLAEEMTPAGYRSSGEMHIRLARSAGEEVFALSENQWDTGAYASGNVRVQADAELTVNKGGGTDKVDAGAGTLFAVVLKRQDMETNIDVASNWRAVYGDPLSGWHVAESADESGGNDTLAGIITAAQEDQHIFTLQQSGSYEVDINDLPGDIETYYYVISGGDEEKNTKAEYTVGYYFTEADSLAGATVDNTYRVVSQDFDRIFSVNLYVPNIQNNLYVQKLDENGQPVSAGADGSGSATFTLYLQDGVTIKNDGTYTVAERTQSYSVDTSDMKTPLPLTGGAMFTRIPNGTYYLIETKAPEGYEKSSEIIPVVVDNTGIYADAGGAGDDVSVQRGVGSIVHSMIQFATDDDIDATLHNIKADLYTAPSASGIPSDENGWGKVNNEGQELHLQFQEDSETLNYRVESDSSYGYFTIDEGWSKLKIYQCLTHYETDSPRTDLDNQELTDLFSGTVVVQVRNTRTGNLKISKDVVNNTGLDGTQTEFEFTLTGSVNRNPLNKTYNAVRTAEGSISTEAVVFNAGKAEITLEDRESIKIQGLPTGAEIKIVEETYPDYKTTYVIGTGQAVEKNDAEVTIPGNSSDVEVTYTNTYHVEGSFTFTKTGTAEDGNSPGPLEGATFAVYRLICTTPDAEGHDHENQLISIEDPETGEVAAEDEGCWELVGAPTTSGTDGVITISGIPVIENTEYRLAELQAPPGFTVPTGQWKLYYDPADKVFKPKSGTGNEASIGNPPAIEKIETGDEITYQIMNYRPGELPFSGNTGIRMFLMIGGMLMILGTAGGTGWYLYHRKPAAVSRHRRRHRR